MAIDAKKHTYPAPGETPTRAALAGAILSINDIIPVANATEAVQVATALAAGGQNLATNPVTVARADASGLHKIEVCYDSTNFAFVPASGIMHFADVAAANAWASTNSSMLTVGDEARVGAVSLIWSGTAWIGGAAVISSFAANWSATSGYTPTVVREGKKRTILGAASRAAGGSLGGILTLAAEDRPDGYVFLGAGVTSAGVAYQLRLAPTGVVDVPYGGGTATAAYPLTGIWWVP